MTIDIDEEARVDAELETKAVVIRDGASLRTADELAECFIDDACGLLDCNQENLSNAEQCDCTEDCDCDFQWREDTAREYEDRLGFAGYTVIWNDGYVIYKDLSPEAVDALAECC